MGKFVVNRDVTCDECHWLAVPVKAGTIVYRYSGFTYGCVGSGMAVCLEEGQPPFFELPRDSLSTPTTPTPDKGRISNHDT